jgi:uncharacterized membrane protein
VLTELTSGRHDGNGRHQSRKSLGLTPPDAQKPRFTAVACSLDTLGGDANELLQRPVQVSETEQRWRRSARITLAALYLAAGVAHIFAPSSFLRIVPTWVPHPSLVVLATGLCEVAGASGLILSPTRRAAGVMLALYAACVYPANIMHAVRDLSSGTGLGWAYHYPRLFIQPLICWWALWAGSVVGNR